MAETTPPSGEQRLRILCVTQGQWGERIADNVGHHSPTTWEVHRWSAPRFLPPVVDDAEDFLPPTLPPVDLVLALGETAGVAQLIPDIVTMTGAKSVIAPIDRNESLPQGLAVQLDRWLKDLGVAAVFPRPFCSLTETAYNAPPIEVAYDDALIRAFAAQFGNPKFKVTVDDDGVVSQVALERDTACGCGRYVAEGLAGTPADDAVHAAGMLHHHYPCLASMNQDTDYHDTLMHVSGHILRGAVKEEIQMHLQATPYLRPAGRVDESGAE